MTSITNSLQDMTSVVHFFNHLLFSPDGSRFIFFDCWIPGPVWKFAARMFTADVNGKNLCLLDDFAYVSHFIWRDSNHILAWSDRPFHGKGFYLYKDGIGEIDIIGQEAMTVNGHCTYLPGNEWILNDTYPDVIYTSALTTVDHRWLSMLYTRIKGVKWYWSI
jgi:hypothetical protein